MARKRSREAKRANRVVNGFEQRSNPAGDAGVELVEQAHRPEQHAAVRRRGKARRPNLPVDFGGRRSTEQLDHPGLVA